MNKKMKITGIQYNWRQVADDDEIGEDYDYAEVGVESVVAITDNRLNLGSFNIIFENGAMIELFNPNKIYYEPIS